MTLTLKCLVKNTMAEFVCYRDGDLWYRIIGPGVTGANVPTLGESTGSVQFTFEFPVPIADTGSGVFPAQLKAITLMRWVRRHRERIQRGEWC